MDKHIKVNLDDEIIARLEYHDGDGVDWEEYIDPETDKKYSVSIEIVRHWYKAEEIVEMTKNPLLYIFNGNVLEITFKTIIHHFSNIAVPNIKRNIMLKKELNGKSYKDKKYNP